MKTLIKKVLAFIAVFAILGGAAFVLTHDMIEDETYVGDEEAIEAIMDNEGDKIIEAPVVEDDGTIYYRVSDENGHTWSCWVYR